MKKQPSDVIKHLNLLLKSELTAINQYFLHARMLKHMGYEKMAAKEYEESIEEMKHADLLMQRIFLLGGLPNLQDLGKLRIGEDPVEILEADYAMEKEYRVQLLEAHKACGAPYDPISTNLIEEILGAEERHLEWLEAQLKLVKEMGRENYLQSQV